MPEFFEFERKPDGVFVSMDFINRLMPAAKGAFVKVYLYMLMKAENGESCTAADIASRMGILESDVARAVSYWCEAGALGTEGNKISFTSSKPAADAQTRPAQQADEHTAAEVSDLSQRPDVGTAADALASDELLSNMCDMVQLMLGTTLSPQETSTLYWFYDGLGFTPDVILMLFEYCVSLEKRNMRYIEKVAIAWHEQGIRTIEQVQEYLKNEKEKSGYINTIRRIMRIDRAFSHSEEEFLSRWHDEYAMSADMVALAYEYCIIQTSKLSFPYMDRILANWHEKNIYTVEAAEEENRSFKSSAAQQKNTVRREGTQPSSVYSDKTDHDELERLVWDHLGKK